MIFQLFIDILNQIGFTTESIELLYFTWKNMESKDHCVCYIKKYN
jgi:hypothetical protein